MNRIAHLFAAVLFCCLPLVAASCGAAKSPEKTTENAPEKSSEPHSKEAPESAAAAGNPVVVMKTSMGDIELEMFKDAAPKTVANFIGLATGTKEFTDPRTNQKVKRPYYDGLIFHRVIEDFMIQGGCPLGSGTGSPGYKFADEISAKSFGYDKLMVYVNGKPNPKLRIGRPDFQRGAVAPTVKKLNIDVSNRATASANMQARETEIIAELEKMSYEQLLTNLGYKYDDSLASKAPKRGVIAMANSGPNTNGSQFFINLVDTDHLTCKHTVFGRVIKGMDVVDKIGVTAVGAGSKPADDVRIISVRVKAKN